MTQRESSTLRLGSSLPRVSQPMAPLSGRAQWPAQQQDSSNRGSLTARRNTRNTTDLEDDPLHPLRTMADRVGKEVEKFAQRVDTWHTQIHENENANAKYHSTLEVIGNFKDIANKTVKELKKQNEVENKAQFQKSVMRRIETDVVEDPSESETEGTVSFRSIVPSVETGAIPPSTRVNELRQWQTEAATWDLLQVIIAHQYPEPGKDVVSEKRALLEEVGGLSRYSPNSEIWDRFLLEDEHAKEKELVLRWLERCARDHQEEIETITEELEEKSGKHIHTWTSGWLDTKSTIKQAKRMQGIEGPLSADHDGLKNRSRTQTLITQLDPDAPGRQKRCLEESDEFYDRALWMVCYEMLRRGVPWEDIAEWCKERNESWRGISIGAAYESHPDGGPNVAGPTVGYLFRRMCYYAAHGARGNHEAAVYGLLSGDLSSMEGVCRSWNSQLYARYNALLLSRFDGYLLKNHSHRVPETIAHKFAFSDAVANIGDWQTSSRTVVEILKQLKSHEITSQALSPMKLIQGSLIGKTVAELIFRVGVAIAIMLQNDDRPTSLILDPEVQSGETEPKKKIPLAQRKITAEKYHENLASDPHALRILAHILIILRQGLGVINTKKYPEWAALDNVIVAYIEFLRITKRIGLIPLYAAQLHGDRRKHCVSRVLPEIKNFEEQQQFVRLLNTYQIQPVDVVSWNYTLTAEREFSNKADYITKYNMLEPVVDPTLSYLWPSKRIIPEFIGLEVQLEEEALVDTLRWHIHLTKDIKHTFNNLHSALICFLLNGCIGAAIEVITELSVETISHIRTEALCGYAFDFTIPGSEYQDETQATGPGYPTAAEHAKYVENLREESSIYFELQQLVRLIVLFREWREEESVLISKKNDAGAKVSTKKIKDLFEAIQVTLESILDHDFLGGLGDHPDALTLKKIYIPEVILAYISIVQAAAYFTNRELATKAMDIATTIADADKQWLQEIFLETGRMSELVDELALVSMAMLKLGEAETKGSRTKKRGSRGESLRVWDLNVRN